MNPDDGANSERGELAVGPLQHLSLCVRDAAEARAFYTGVLGLREIERPDFPMSGLWLQAGTVQIHLIVPFDNAELPKARRLDRTPVAAHTAFEVPSLDPWISNLRAKGIAVILSEFVEGQAFITDPSGNILELNAPAAASRAD